MRLELISIARQATIFPIRLTRICLIGFEPISLAPQANILPIKLQAKSGERELNP